MIDKDPTPGRRIITGSQDFPLLQSVRQSPKGRTAVFNPLPMARGETLRFGMHSESLEECLFKESYPRKFDADPSGFDCCSSYDAAYFERDVRMVSHVGDLTSFQRFDALCAGMTAQWLNYAAPSWDCLTSPPTARAWFGIHAIGFLAFRLPAVHDNIRRFLVKLLKLHRYGCRWRTCLPAARNPRSWAAAHACTARPDFRDLGCLRNRQAQVQPR